MWYYIKKEWKMNSLILFLHIVFAAITVATNLLMIEIMQSIIDVDLQGFLFWMCASAVLWLVYDVVSVLLRKAKYCTVARMNNRVRADISASILKKDYQDYHTQQTGEYLSWYSNDVSQIESDAFFSFYNLFGGAFTILFSIISLAYIHWSLLAASLVAAVVIFILPKFVGKRVEKASEYCAKEQALGMSKLKDLLSGLDVLRAFGHASRFVLDNEEASDQIEQPKRKLKGVKAVANAIVEYISVLCQFGVLVLVGILSISGTIAAGSLLGTGNLAGTIYNGLGEQAQYILSIRGCRPYFQKITTHATKKLSVSDGKSKTGVHGEITMENIHFSYDGEKPILENQSLTFKKGGKYALTGPSGCGKSTILKLLLGWLPGYSGSIRFDGKDARGFTSDEIQEQMSYIEQNVFLFNSTIRDNITLGDTYTEEQLRKALHDSALEQDLQKMPQGLDTPVGENGSSLSGGQKQRVAIARALIHNRSILLVDEGTSALDQKNADIVEESLLRNPKLTLILVSHHLSPERKKQFTKVYDFT